MNSSIRRMTDHLKTLFRKMFKLTNEPQFTLRDDFTFMIINNHWIELKSHIITDQRTKYFINVFRYFIIFTSRDIQHSFVVTVDSTVDFLVIFLKVWRMAEPVKIITFKKVEIVILTVVCGLEFLL